MNKRLVKQSILTLALAGLISQFSAENVYAEEEKQMVVVYENEQGERAIQDSGAAVEEQYDHLSAAAISADAETIDELKEDPDIKYVEPDSKIRIADNGESKQSQTAAIEQWNLASIHAPMAWEDGLTGNGVKIAIMDSGIYPHEDLEIAGGFSAVDYTTSYDDDDGHGTHVAGIIGAKHDGKGIDGIAPDAELYAVKVLDETGEGYLSDLLEGIDWAITQNMDIINLSMGTADKSDALEDAVGKAYQAGILLVAASGNEGAGYPVDYPAAYEPVIAVSATDSNNNITSFSSVGDKVEIAAPGADIQSTLPGADYGVMSGTSQATSHVSAMLAILKQQFPADTNGQLRQRLQQYSTDLGQEGRDGLYGFGLIQYPAPGSTDELVSDPAEGNSSQDEVEESVPAEELQALADELDMTLEELADLFAASGFDLYSYANMGKIDDIMYQDVNEVSVYVLLENMGLSRDELDQLLAADDMALADFENVEELTDYVYRKGSNDFDTYWHQTSSALQEIGISKEEGRKLYDHLESVLGSISDDTIDEIASLSERAKAIGDFESLNDLDEGQREELVSLWYDFIELFQLKAKFYLMDGDEEREVTIEELSQITDIGKQTLLVELYDTKDEFLLDLSVNGEQFDQNLLHAPEVSPEEKKTDGVQNPKLEEPEKEAEEITLTYKTAESVGQESDKDKNQDHPDKEGQRLPDTASPIGNIVAAGLALTAAGVILYARNRRMKYRTR
ncbi:processed acidic surface protein [Terribacillus sp. 179-K 1B1 HS]|uniref:processed acidic surface protein n=1 Tax=Terribacillus sp. 179-K 1B1 HS TaxID=3142388 RepID=UPI0039A12771